MNYTFSYAIAINTWATDNDRELQLEVNKSVILIITITTEKGRSTS